MWALANKTPYAAERNWTRDKRGVHHWLVAVKATYTITADQKISLADEQTSPLLEPVYRGDPATTSLRFDSDLLAWKPLTDINIDGQAHAPDGQRAASVTVSMRVGPVDKTLVVHGLRLYYRGAIGLTTTAPRPFNVRPIHYEWAFGGLDTAHADPKKHGMDARNPIGKGFAVDSARLIEQPAHAVEYPDGNPAKRGPAGFGPIASSWSPRLELAGTYDEAWAKTKKPLLPDDYDERFALSAPPDQRPPKPLAGGEPVELINLTASGKLRFALPKTALTCSTRFGTRSEQHPVALASVIIVPDERRLMMVWQSALRVPSREVEHLDQTTITEMHRT